MSVLKEQKLIAEPDQQHGRWALIGAGRGWGGTQIRSNTEGKHAHIWSTLRG